MNTRALAPTFLLLTAALSAQAPPSALPLPPADVLTKCCALTADEHGQPIGLGRDYKIHFLADRSVFVPCLGMAAPHDLPFGLQVTHVGRGDLAAVGPAERQVHEQHVAYVRTQLTERLAVRSEGVKQDFVFDRLPAGDGDLVVRLRLDTPLTPTSSESRSTMQFTFPGAGGVEVGQVVGVDAAGRSATGVLRCVGEHLDVVLPAAFVRDAALPLVVDPMLAPLFATTINMANDVDVQVTHGSSSISRYLIVWRRIVSATNFDILGRGYAVAGNLMGAVTGIETTAVNAGLPRAAGMGASGSLVVFELADNIAGRLVRHAPSTTVDAFTIANTANVETAPDVVNVTGFTDDTAVVAWEDATTNQIRARLVVVQGIPVTPLTIQTLVTGTSNNVVHRPALARFAPPASTLVTYEVSHPPLFPLAAFTQVSAIRMTPFGQVVGAPFVIAGTSINSAFNPSIAGDGDNFVVAYETQGLATQGISCVSVRLASSAQELGAPRTIAAGPSSNPQAAWFPGSAAVVWTRPNGAANDVLLTSFDPFLCADCEGLLTLATGGCDAVVGIGPRTDAGFTDEAAVVWARLVGPPTELNAQRFRPTDGALFELGGACIPSGRIAAPCARIGNFDFGFQLTDAAPGQLSFLALSLATVPLPCGPCTVHPDTVNGIIAFTGVTTAAGTARYGLVLPGLPSLVGTNLFGQFAMFGTNCLANFDLTQAIRVTLQ
ncbi:MAG: hypothetical protein WAT39_18280 [Planctomycetota bacterium]